MALVLFVVPLLVLAAVFVLYGEEVRAQRLRAQLERSYEARGHVLMLFSALQEAQLGQRGFVLTSDRRFLRPYEQARGQIAGHFARLKRDLRDEPDQLRRVSRLEALSDRQLRFFAVTVDLVRTGRAGEATAAVRRGEGKTTMDAIRREVAEIRAAEERRLAARARAADDATRRTEIITAGLFLSLVALLFAAVSLVRRGLRERAALARKRDEIAARQRAVLENAFDGILTLNPSGSVETVNRAAERLFGISEVEARGRDVGNFLDLAPGGEGSFRDRLGLGGTEGEVREVAARRAGGETFPADVALGLMPLTGGDYVVVTVRDASERKRVEALKSEFVSTVSHELRTPLTSIAGSLGLLLAGVAGELPEKSRRLVEIAHKNCQRLVRLINDLLDVEKLAAGKMELKLAPLDLAELAAGAVEEIRGFADRQGVGLRLSADGPVPVTGDGDRLLQVLVNLLSNAAKFSPAGSVVDVEVATASGRAVARVRDRGAGIPDAFRDRIFERFAQADGADTRGHQGSGLGLAIAKEIVERHGGRLTFEPAPGGGTIFAVELPATPEADAIPEPGRPRLLLCEDDPDAAEVLRQVLHAQGFAVDVAPTLARARAAVEAGGYAALILDLVLPDGSGLEFLSDLRRDPALAGLPVIVATGVDAADAAERVRLLDLVDWIPKPVDPQRLRHAVDLAVAARCGEGCRILHVDDDPDVREVVAVALAGLGEVVEVSNLRDARRVLAGETIDLVVLDLDLPDGNGLELMPAATARGLPIPVIVFSAKDLPAGAELRGVRALTKSRSSLEALASLVRETLDTRGGSTP